MPLREESGKKGMSPKFLEFLVCPLAKCPLQYDAKAHELVSTVAGLAYPVRDGIPVLIPEEARILEENTVKACH